MYKSLVNFMQKMVFNFLQELKSQLERSEQLSNHLQEMFSIQLMKLQEENKELSNNILVFKQKLEKQKQVKAWCVMGVL